MSGRKFGYRSTSREPAGARVIAAIARPDGAAVALPAGFPLRRATFRRRGDHLGVCASGYPETFIPGFFRPGGPTTLVAADGGVEVSRHMFFRMLCLSERVERALGALDAPGVGEG